VRELRYALVEAREAMIGAIVQDVQRPAAEILPTEILPTAAALAHLETMAPTVLAPRWANRAPFWLLGTRARVERAPWGVVGVIGTWNYPLFLNAVPLAQALAAGNAVVWKPSERTPRFAALFGQILRACGFPAGLVQALPAERDGGALLAAAPIDFLHFTGSSQVGRELAANLGQRMIPSVLELSGCDAVVVLSDADLEMAAHAAWYGCTLNGGRTCMATRRVLVARSVLGDFKQQLANVQAKYGTAHPVVIHDGTDDTTVKFAAEFSLLTFDTIEEARALLAASDSQLTVAIFTAAPPLHRVWARTLRVGTVIFNDVIVPTAHPDTPFGGVGDSGWNVTQGREGLLAFTRPLVIAERTGRFRPHIQTQLEADAAGADITTGALLARHARTWGQRYAGVRQLLRGFRSFGKKPPDDI